MLNDVRIFEASVFNLELNLNFTNSKAKYCSEPVCLSVYGSISLLVNCPQSRIEVRLTALWLVLGLTLTFNPGRAVVMTHTYASSRFKNRVETDGRTQAIALLPMLKWSVKITWLNFTNFLWLLPIPWLSHPVVALWYTGSLCLWVTPKFNTEPLNQSLKTGVKPFLTLQTRIRSESTNLRQTRHDTISE